MKKNKKYFIISGFAAFLGISLLIVSSFLGTNGDDKIDNNSDNQNSNILLSNAKVKCEKIMETTNVRNITYSYLINIDSSSNIADYTFKNIIDFELKNEYDKMKNVNFPDVEVSYDDNELIIIKSLIIDKIFSDDGTEIKVSYKDFVSSLEQEGYTCSQQ